MSQPRTHDWNKGRVVLDRRGSDGEYDVRYPRKAHPNERPAPSYYGPNFSNVENKRSASLAYGDIRHPRMPDPYVKRPQPYPVEVQRDYDEYKKYGDLYADAKAKTKDNKKLLRTGVDKPQYRQIMETVRDTAHGSMVAANTAAAARTGFAHKYPYAYEDLDAQRTHHKSANDLLNGARNARSQEQKASRGLLRGK
ncbi:hypothetical protein ALT_3219 [Aspergillus lentulus]|uniref:Uncharacterized protein n=1 Tax=Aspergillus lentulus TaxID=293939 RepID=A0AAN4PGV6_ASPLE|nr:hypothetical protein CNMCM6069_003429 [Aspergillus lentulus]KAF4170176.1 hypothetical protein CNMCM6936_003364 [Aspergillus lentulus]GAQ05898.1 hypothetical protein ALT_3219 [Aspergillus lentulus]GFG14446.1 hypothetical protein IFM61392_08459 [Aspergillus lentulus]